MYYTTTAEGYPVLLKTKTRSKFLSETHLPRRRSAWVYLTQNPSGRWQVLTSDGEGGVTCVAGAPTPAQVLPVMVETARELGILGKRTDRPNDPVRWALYLLGGYVTRAQQEQNR